MRYQASAVQNALAVTVPKLCASLGTVCTVANTSGSSLNTAIRIRKIHAFVATATIGTGANIVINFAAAGNTLPLEVTDTALTSGDLAEVTVVPPKDSQASFWQTFTSSTTLFTITCSANCYLDIDLDYVQCDNEVTPTISYVSGAATVGTIYYTGLSGTSNGFLPFGLTTNY